MASRQGRHPQPALSQTLRRQESPWRPRPRRRSPALDSSGGLSRAEEPPETNQTVAWPPALLKRVRRVNSRIRFPIAQVNEPRAIPAVREWIERRSSYLDVHSRELRFVRSGISRPHLLTPAPPSPLTKPRLKGRSSSRLPVEPHDRSQRPVMTQGTARAAPRQVRVLYSVLLCQEHGL